MRRSIRPTRATRPSDASVDHTDARKATVRCFGRSDRRSPPERQSSAAAAPYELRTRRNQDAGRLLQRLVRWAIRLQASGLVAPRTWHGPD
jgi:hypothetical protein